jgi:phosphate transport system substrate-binding protein
MYHNTHANVTITYPGGGSGAGVNQIMNKSIDFGASDAPLNAGQKILLPNILQIPETVGSVTTSYNLTDTNGVQIPGGLNLTGNILANIYMGNIFRWNDSAIQTLNPHVLLPGNNITVVHRSDSSGTTFVWTSFLSLSDNFWSNTYGNVTGFPVGKWPCDPKCVGASGNPGVALFIKSHPFTLGYVELNYAIQNKFAYADIQNPQGNFITPTLLTTGYAVGNSTSSLPEGNGDWSHVSLLKAAGPNTYPIASFTYLLIYKELNVIPSMDSNEGAQAIELVRFLNWAITTGQTYSSGNYYVPLHPNVVAIDQRAINSITFKTNSAPIHRTINISADNTLGWSPSSIQVVSGDNVTLMLSSHDLASHQFWIEVGRNNQIVDPNETQTESPVFSTSTPISFTFTPVIYSQNSFPSSGTFIFRDVNNPTGPSGTFQVSQQQTATVFTQPSSSLTTLSRPVIDSSRVSVAGTMLTDSRIGTLSGNITVAAVDSVSGSLTFARGYSIPNLGTAKFGLNVGVIPNALSVNLQGGTIWTLTRSVDVNGDGAINIIDLAVCAIHFGTTIGQPNYSAKADFNADGVVNIVDLVVVAGNFGGIVLN